MPVTVKVHVEAARDLPVMDRKSELTDAYVEVRLGERPSMRTKSFPKSLNPVWSKNFRVEVAEDATLQDDPIEFRVLDRDVVSADDSIGVVYVDPSSLLLPSSVPSPAVSASLASSGSPGTSAVACSSSPPTSSAAASTSASTRSTSSISGWFPIYDTLKGVRGELLLSVRLEGFENANPFADPSAGVQFFSAASPIPGLSRVSGFVSSCAVEDDPEHQWADTFRTSRNSNEARQLLLYKITGRLRRRMARKVRELGCNAVIGFRQSIELEGEVGLVARGYGTAAVVAPLEESEFAAAAVQLQQQLLQQQQHQQSSSPKGTAAQADSPGSPTIHSPIMMPVATPMRNAMRVSEDHTPPTPGALFGAASRLPLMTLTAVEPGTLCHIGGVVATRLVRVLKRGESTATQREHWWLEAREEIRQHTLSLGCTHVLGYSESVFSHEQGGVCILSAVGTAAVLSCGATEMPQSARSADVPFHKATKKPDAKHSCRMCHIPYARSQVLPFPVHLNRCKECNTKLVPDVLLSTIEPPEHLSILGIGKLVQARAARVKKHSIGETNAVTVSSLLPFVEYELHSQLLYKLRVLGMNAIFRLQYDLSMSETMVVATATGTAVYVEALPPPVLLSLDHEPFGVSAIQKRIKDESVKNSTKFRQLLAEKKQQDATKEAEGRPHTAPRDEEPSPPDKEKEKRKHRKKGSTASVGTAASPKKDRGGKGAKKTRKKHAGKDMEGKHASDAVEDDAAIDGLEEFALEGKDHHQQKHRADHHSASDSDEPRVIAKRDHEQPFVVSVTDEVDEDLAEAILEPARPADVHLSTTEQQPGSWVAGKDTQLIVVVRRVRWKGASSPGKQLRLTLDQLIDSTVFNVASLAPCSLSVLNTRVDLVDQTNEVHITLTALCSSGRNGVQAAAPVGYPLSNLRRSTMDDDMMPFAMDDVSGAMQASVPFSPERSPTKRSATSMFPGGVLLTPASSIPDKTVSKYLGFVNVHLVRESFSLKNELGIEGLATDFLVDVLAILRAQVAGMGGNALLCFMLNVFHFKSNNYKDQGYILISISGDAVRYLDTPQLMAI